MKKLFPLLVVVSFLSWACEDEEESGASCADLTAAYATSAAAVTDNATCDASMVDLIAWLDAGCDTEDAYDADTEAMFRDGTYCDSLYPES